MSNWKYGLTLIVCTSCDGHGKTQYRCKRCGDMGELWVVPRQDGQGAGFLVKVGELEKSPTFKHLRATS